MKEIIQEVVARLQLASQDDTPAPACIYGDAPIPCDSTTKYGMNEEG